MTTSSLILPELAEREIERRDRSSRLTGFTRAFLVWTGLAVLAIAQSAMSFSERGQPIRWGQLVPSRLLDWYSCAMFTPVLLWLVRRFPLDAANAARRAPLYLLVTSACVAAKYAVMVLVINNFAQPRVTYTRLLTQNFLLELMIFWAVVAALHAVELQRTLAAREQAALELRAQLSEAQLRVLKAQLQPHFLFNTLNGVASLIHTAPKTADFIVVQLADLLRASLDHEGTREIPLADELALLDKYLAIMKARFGERVTIVRDIDPAALRTLVPQLLLQPLAENAFEHGIGQRGGSGMIAIRAHIAGSLLRLEISDDGAGLSGAAPEEGVGLGNSRQRLARLYGERQSITLAPRPEGGATVVVELPCHQG
jgi:two-component system, LytTR family, sensor kinase